MMDIERRDVGGARRVRARRALIAALGAAGLVACAAPGSGGGSSGGAAPPPTDADQDAAPPGPVSLPFTVSDEFVPSGYMGDSPTDFGGISMTTDATSCPSPRAPGAAGDCYTIDWTPALASGATSAWVGVYWQWPANNWGAKPGKTILPGAKKVTFSAAGAAGGEAVHFAVGGVNVKGGDPTLTHKDSFTAGIDATLTTSWQHFEIPLTSASYDAVIGGFSWTATASSSKPVRFFLDDVRWEP